MPTENRSKNHHYIPRSILKQFCFSGDSLLLYDANDPSKGYRQRSIDRAFQKFHANSIHLDDGTKTDHVERWLAAEVDSPLGHILHDARKDIRSLFHPDSKRVLAKYVITLLFRAPRGRGFWREASEPILDLFQQVGDLAKQIGVEGFDMFGGAMPESFKDAFDVVLPTLVDENHLTVFEDSDLAIAYPSDGDVFCLSDFPMMRYDDPRNAVDDLMHECWFLLSPYAAACFFLKSKLRVQDQLFPLPNSYIRRINFDFAMRSQLVASNCAVQLHRTVKHLGAFPHARSLAETKPEMFEFGGSYY